MRDFPPTLKRFGQHFLVDASVLDAIVGALEIAPEDTVVEIGPGRGALTDLLAARARRVIAVELDHALAELLRERYGSGSDSDGGSVEIVEQDVLRVSLGELGGDGYILAGNVPYYITTPILFHALTPPLPRRSVFLVQREVAERAIAAPGSKTYGALSVNLQAVANVEIVVTVPPRAFRPPPSVESAVMRWTPLAEPLVRQNERERFQAFVQGAFGLRRKQLGRVMRTLCGMSAVDATTTLEQVGIDPAVRPETLSPAQFAQLFHVVRQGE
jgi:16S rRNA (adenine1518-N6/adenine1519-N6)-dimethyltransferase